MGPVVKASGTERHQRRRESSGHSPLSPIKSSLIRNAENPPVRATSILSKAIDKHPAGIPQPLFEEIVISDLVLSFLHPFISGSAMGIGCPGHRLDDAPGVSEMVGTPSLINTGGRRSRIGSRDRFQVPAVSVL
jgi:hypothetical protein